MKQTRWLLRSMKIKGRRFSTISSPTSSISYLPQPILPFLSKDFLSSPRSNNIHIDLAALHAYSLVTGLLHDPIAASRVVELCLRAKPDSPIPAAACFRSIPRPDAYTWNLMISAHVDPTSPSESLWYYTRMRSATSGPPPTTHTFALIVKACVSCRAGVGLSRGVHGQVLKCGVEDHLVVKNSLLGMYCGLGLLTDARFLFDASSQLDTISYHAIIGAYGRIGDVQAARELFETMPERNVVSWSVMIDGYIQCGQFAEALSLFSRSQGEGVFPDEVLLVSVLKACANLGAIEHGRWIHHFIKRNNMGRGRANVILTTALVDMYGKCGCVDAALEVFNEAVAYGDVVLWNAIISGLAMHGHVRKALDIFNRMRAYGVSPNDVTFIAVLCACGHAGLVREGIAIFESMAKVYGIVPRREHYGCLVDLLGRAGLVKEAEQLLFSMPKDVQPHASQWGALMSACQKYGNVEVGERTGKILISLEPDDGGRYVSLSSIYAVAGKQNEARATRGVMDECGIKKETGCSFIEFGGTIHEFIVGDTRHHNCAEIYKMLSIIEKNFQLEEQWREGGTN